MLKRHGRTAAKRFGMEQTEEAIYELRCDLQRVPLPFLSTEFMSSQAEIPGRTSDEGGYYRAYFTRSPRQCSRWPAKMPSVK
jgi:hypothetical protein